MFSSRTALSSCREVKSKGENRVRVSIWKISVFITNLKSWSSISPFRVSECSPCIFFSVSQLLVQMPALAMATMADSERRSLLLRNFF